MCTPAASQAARAFDGDVDQLDDTLAVDRHQRVDRKKTQARIRTKEVAASSRLMGSLVWVGSLVPNGEDLRGHGDFARFDGCVAAQS
jgi:hypothetical protein